MAGGRNSGSPLQIMLSAEFFKKPEALHPGFKLVGGYVQADPNKVTMLLPQSDHITGIREYGNMRYAVFSQFRQLFIALDTY